MKWWAPHPPIRPMYMVLSCFSCVRLFATLWTVARQAPLSEGFSRQEYWGGLPCPPPWDLSDPGIKPASSVTPALQKDSFTTEPLGKPKKACRKHQKDSWISLKKANKVRFGQERKKLKVKPKDGTTSESKAIGCLVVLVAFLFPFKWVGESHKALPPWQWYLLA